MKLCRIGFVFLFVVALGSCVTPPPSQSPAESPTAEAAPERRRPAPEGGGALAELVDEMVQAPWIDRYSAPPRVVVTAVFDRAGRNLNSLAAVTEIERLLLETAVVDVVVGSAARSLVRAERLDQQEQAAPETVQRLGEELGAEYMLYGVVFRRPAEAQEADRQAGKRRIAAARISFSLVEVETNRTVWIGSREFFW
jgi:hypothetical protein